ncbi:MAG: stage 0 sporulation family protein [Spirochaetia bacterium]
MSGQAAILYLVKVLHCSETELCAQPEGFPVHKGDLVVIPTKYGKDLGRITGEIRSQDGEEWSEIREILRPANEQDIQQYEENRIKEKEAFEICKKKIEKHRLDMKLVTTHYILDEPKILFFFTADARVDFRQLVKDLVSVFRTRIELRQIGVRDESRVLGGLGVCGRTYCCHGLTDKLKPVSIKMAKVQDLSLNSMKISGPCGRLLCCLFYEYDQYTEEKKNFPQPGYKIYHEGTEFRVVDVNILSRILKLSGDDGRYLSIPACQLKFDEKMRKWEITEAHCASSI